MMRAYILFRRRFMTTFISRLFASLFPVGVYYIKLSVADPASQERYHKTWAGVQKCAEAYHLLSLSGPDIVTVWSDSNGKYYRDEKGESEIKLLD